MLLRKDAIAIYSASAEDLDVAFCFFFIQEISESLNFMQNSVYDLLEMGHDAQLESQ